MPNRRLRRQLDAIEENLTTKPDSALVDHLRIPDKFVPPGRRIARRVNGTVERQWMYDGQLRIVGEVVYQAQVSYRVYGYVPERHLPVLMLEGR